MGCTFGCCVQEEVDDNYHENEEVVHTSEIQKVRDVRVAIFGTAGSGKSTIVKHMRLLNEGSFDELDQRQYKPVIYSNVIHSLLDIIEAMHEMNLDFENKARRKDHVIVDLVVKRHLEEKAYNLQVFEAMKRIWADGSIQATFARRNEYQLMDNVEYFFNDLDRLADDDYEPTDRDIVLTHIRTTGITRISIVFDDLRFELIDVAGHRAERRKWVNCFQNIDAMIYCCAISEFDQKLNEDNRTNRLEDSYALLNSLYQSRWLHNTVVIMFWTKKDLFDMKIKSAQSSTSTDGLTSFDDFVEEFEERCPFLYQEQVQCYFHVMSSIISDVHAVYDDVTDTILENNLNETRLF
ncbi:Guanine nucleotide-binding protein G(o) like protein [Argiope bruennichi]|uniref:Guanine nucleotide-binding protein G(O) like protein n=1 Tax=Argiope bruennichi TaxID=94029 RepID=A0A8T0F0A1_ARGBR|nr:Guanine nucleotide-binding protein G(o) like protein [Argiope bruennichi]